MSVRLIDKVSLSQIAVGASPFYGLTVRLNFLKNYLIRNWFTYPLCPVFHAPRKSKSVKMTSVEKKSLPLSTSEARSIENYL